ncbi:MAG: Rab family GTPase [Thermoplasmata archaeon]
MKKKMKMKICMVGEGAVGKTSLIRRFVLDKFDDKYLQTLGTKVSKKEIVVDYPERDVELQVDMTIWDIMGQKGFRELLKEAYFYGAKGIIAVCDVTRKDTLSELDDWIEGVYSVTGRVPIEFLANKVDLKDAKAIAEKDLEQASRAYDSKYFFTSAKTGVNVEEAFKELAEKIARAKLTEREE